MSVNILTWLCAAVFVSHAAKLPPTFKRCKDDNTLSACLLKTVNDVLPEFTKGMEKYHVPTFHPLHVPEVTIDVNGGLKIDLKNVDVLGLDQCTASSVRMDTKKKTVDLELKTTHINLEGEYKIQGRILILPISGEGILNITWVNPDIKYHFDYDFVDRNNKKYIVPKNSKFEYDPERVYFYLENLFNGDKNLGEQMNIFLNENWREVNNEIGKDTGQATGEIITAVVSNFFSRIPYKELLE